MRVWMFIGLWMTLIANPILAQTPLDAESPLEFEEAINRSLSASSSVKQAEHALDAQREKKRSDWANTGPKVSAEYNEVYFDDKQTAQFGPQEIVIRDDESKIGSVTIAQPITGLWALTEKARFEGAQEHLKQQSLNQSRLEAAFGTAETYLRAKQAVRLHEIAVSSVAAAQDQLKDARALERAGRINRGDLLRIELAHSEAQAREAQAKAQRDIAIAALREAIGMEPGPVLSLSPELPPAKEGVLPAYEAAVQQALQSRIEVEQARTGTELASFGSKLAYAQFSPNVNAFMKFERNFGEVAGLGGAKDMRTYGIQLQWDIWNNGSNIFNVRKAAAESARAEEAERSVEQRIRLDVYQTLENLKAARDQVALAEVAVKQAEESYRIEQARFKTGTRSATDVVLAENSQAGAQGRLVTASTDLMVWSFRLQRATGGTRPILEIFK